MWATGGGDSGGFDFGSNGGSGDVKKAPRNLLVVGRWGGGGFRIDFDVDVDVDIGGGGNGNGDGDGGSGGDGGRGGNGDGNGDDDGGDDGDYSSSGGDGGNGGGNGTDVKKAPPNPLISETVHNKRVDNDGGPASEVE